MKLAAKIIFVAIISVIAVLMVSNYFTTKMAFTRIESDHQKYAERMTSEMDDAIIDAWKQGGMKAVAETLSSRPNQQAIRWVWFEQSVSQSTTPTATADFSQVVIRNQTASFITTGDDGSRQLNTYRFVDLGEARPGGLEFAMPLDQHDENIQFDFFETLISVSAMALVSIFVVLFAGVRMIAKPLKKLTNATERIGNGDFSSRVKLPSTDELGQLANSINNMSEQLEIQQDEIKNETNQKMSALKQLRHADRLKTVGRMAAGIAHQIGTPLSVVSGRAGLIAEGKLNHEKLHLNAVTIQKETEKISAMIRQLLNFARQMPMQKNHFDLNEVLSQTYDLLKPLAEKQKIDVKISLAAMPANSVIDAVQIQQVLTNVIMNAIHSMPDGGTLELGVTSHQTAFKSSTLENYWGISIADQGCGISDNDLESIFEPFFTTKDIGEGTGLGLSIAHNIIIEHYGWIDVESDVGKGSRFQIFLPASND